MTNEKAKADLAFAREIVDRVKARSKPPKPAKDLTTLAGDLVANAAAECLNEAVMSGALRARLANALEAYGLARSQQLLDDPQRCTVAHWDKPPPTERSF